MTTLLVRRRKGPYACVIARPATLRPSIHDAYWKRRGPNTALATRPGRHSRRSTDLVSRVGRGSARETRQ